MAWPLAETLAIASPPSSVVHNVPCASSATPVGDALFVGSVTYVACSARGAAVATGLDVVGVDDDPHAANTPTAITASGAAARRGVGGSVFVDKVTEALPFGHPRR